MQAPLYIKSAVSISPQHTFLSSDWQQYLLPKTTDALTAQLPDFRAYINPVAIRRMSRLVKMGISCGMEALAQAGVTSPDAIITGTGRGSMTDTQTFLKDMIRLKEEALNPTHFIQSTYNNINGWLALQTKSNTYNQTYLHRGASFEWTLLDAQLLVAERSPEQQNILVGSFDEITADYYTIKSNIDFWKKDDRSNLDLFTEPLTPGTIAGEAASFFCVSSHGDKEAISISHLEIGLENSVSEWQRLFKNLLASPHFNLEDVDVVLTGNNGDATMQALYEQVQLDTGPRPQVPFKHLCGDFDTATGFGLFVAYEILKSGRLPSVLQQKNIVEKAPIKSVLLVNHYLSQHLSVILITKR